MDMKCKKTMNIQRQIRIIFSSLSASLPFFLVTIFPLEKIGILLFEQITNVAVSLHFATCYISVFFTDKD